VLRLRLYLTSSVTSFATTARPAFSLTSRQARPLLAKTHNIFAEARHPGREGFAALKRYLAWMSQSASHKSRPTVLLLDATIMRATCGRGRASWQLNSGRSGDNGGDTGADGKMEAETRRSTSNVFGGNDLGSKRQSWKTNQTIKWAVTRGMWFYSQSAKHNPQTPD
jgi:hypothetical protein